MTGSPWPKTVEHMRASLEPIRDDGRFDVPGEVFGACAGAALYRREVVLGLGGFDERYFCYFEDVDLCVRMREAGWRIHSDGGVRVRHHHRGGGEADLPALLAGGQTEPQGDTQGRRQCLVTS